MAFNILIVDDSRIIRSMLERTIRLSGVPVGSLFNAGNGKEGLDILNNNWVDLVLADVNMPVMDGLAMLDRMSRDDLMDKVPVVIVSTEGSETKIDKLWNCGIKAFIRKPFTPEQIRGVIRDVLGDWTDGETDGDDFASSDSF